jgi:2-dehydropantoate 2-reductase
VSVQKLDIGVVGAGGIGSYYGGLLARRGHSVRLLARGDHLEAIRAHGLEVRLPGEEPFVARLDATDDGASLRDRQYVLVAVKSYSLPEVAPVVAAAARAGATIVPLLNGIDVAERLQDLGVPRESIVGGLITASLFRTAPGKVERRTPFDRFVLGELDRSTSERTTLLCEAFADAGVTARVSDDIALDLWRKFAFIVCMNIGSGLTRGPFGQMLATERGKKLIADALHEIVLVSRVAGAPLSDDDESRILADLYALPPATRPSFLADLDRGGPTELDLLAGNVSRLGHLHGVPTPVHDVASTAFEAACQHVTG